MSLKPFFVYLLTHSRELSKPTNTGHLVPQVLPDYSRIISWARKEPSQHLLDAIASDDIALVYPALEGETVSAPDKFFKYIILDGTWQEARKIVNRSPYLQDLPKVMLNSSAPSRYTLRRNQKEQGLCTAECVIELLKINQEYELADELDLAFTQFNGRGYCAEN